MPRRDLRLLLSSIVLGTLLAGCGASGSQAKGPPPVPEVGVVTLAVQAIPVVNELPGRVAAPRTAEVRARAAGILVKREFEEGSDVRAGAVLFRIDPGPLEAALGSARAALAKAEAVLGSVKVKVERFQPLLGTNAISKQDYDDAVALRDQALADVASAKAALVTAQLNLDYTVVTAPISGRIGRALVTEGALVGQGEATPLAIIQQLDPIHVDLTQSSSVLLGLQQALASGRLTKLDNPSVTLLAPDGAELPRKGTLVFTEAVVDETTSSVILRALFANPDHLLLPGMYVRARIQQAWISDAIVVPQQSVNRRPEGASVLVVGADDKLVARVVRVDATHGNGYVIGAGLKAGERVVVDGLQKVRAGAVVKTVPWEAPKSGDPRVTAISASQN
jgi:membrane fusion protein (multidrug efflux system)